MNSGRRGCDSPSSGLGFAQQPRWVGVIRRDPQDFAESLSLSGIYQGSAEPHRNLVSSLYLMSCGFAPCSFIVAELFKKVFLGHFLIRGERFIPGYFQCRIPTQKFPATPAPPFTRNSILARKEVLHFLVASLKKETDEINLIIYFT